MGAVLFCGGLMSATAPRFPGRLWYLILAFFNSEPIDGYQTWSRVTYRNESDAPQLDRILETLRLIRSKTMRGQAAKALVALARSTGNEYLGIGDADSYHFKVLTNHAVLENDKGNLTFRIPSSELRTLIREMGIQGLVAFIRPRKSGGFFEYENEAKLFAALQRAINPCGDRVIAAGILYRLRAMVNEGSWSLDQRYEASIARLVAEKVIVRSPLTTQRYEPANDALGNLLAEVIVGDDGKLRRVP